MSTFNQHPGLAQLAAEPDEHPALVPDLLDLERVELGIGVELALQAEVRPPGTDQVQHSGGGGHGAGSRSTAKVGCGCANNRTGGPPVALSHAIAPLRHRRRDHHCLAVTCSLSPLPSAPTEKGSTVSTGLIALIDDVVGLAKLAAASLDDVAAQATRAGRQGRRHRDRRCGRDAALRRRLRRRARAADRRPDRRWARSRTSCSSCCPRRWR